MTSSEAGRFPIEAAHYIAFSVHDPNSSGNPLGLTEISQRYQIEETTAALFQTDMLDKAEKGFLSGEERTFNVLGRDELTGLRSRIWFKDVARSILEHDARLAPAGQEKFHLAGYVISADVNGLKQINDTLGHIEGDELIKTVGKSLQETFRESDLIGRVGGDEFMVYCSSQNHDAVRVLVDRVRGLLDKVDISVGMIPITAAQAKTFAEAEDFFGTFQELSDKLMYDAKDIAKIKHKSALCYLSEPVRNEHTLPEIIHVAIGNRLQQQVEEK